MNMKRIRLYPILLILSALPSCTVSTGNHTRLEPFPAGNRAADRGGLQDPVAALSAILEEVASGTPENQLATEYRKALEEITRRAEALLTSASHQEAGVYLRAAIDGYPRQADVARQAPLTKEQLRAKRNACADRMMENGLLAYRSGDLDKAIGIWKKIHLFHPKHEPSQQAIRTANLQLANLKTLGSGTP